MSRPATDLERGRLVFVEAVSMYGLAWPFGRYLLWWRRRSVRGDHDEIVALAEPFALCTNKHKCVSYGRSVLV
jgi:hypothetical protein